MSADRNLPCPCGSGLKYKKCCLAKDHAAAPIDAGWPRMRRTEGELELKLKAVLERDYGREAVGMAWGEYALGRDEGGDPREWAEFGTSFVPWLLYDWDPARYAPKKRGKKGVTADEAIAMHRGRPAMTTARYLAARNADTLDSYELRYLEEAGSQSFTFCQVVSVEPGRLMTLRDILRQREVIVHEQRASRSLKPGEIVYTKIVSLDEASVMLGCAPYAIPGRYFDVIAEARDMLMKRRGTMEAVMRKYDIELRHLYLDLREQVLAPEAPAMQNTDGDPLQPTRMDFKLGCTPQQAVDALLPLTGETDAGAFADTCTYEADGVLEAAEIPWLRSEGGPQSGRATELAMFTIRRGRMTVRVNSQRRVAAVTAEVAARLGTWAVLKGSVVESVEQMMAAREAGARQGAQMRGAMPEELEQLPEVRALIERLSAEHWATWLDIPLPALRGKTPREAAGTMAGRERLEALLLEFAGHQNAPNVMRPDVAALRRELGLDREGPTDPLPTDPAAAAHSPAMTIADFTHVIDQPGRASTSKAPPLALQMRAVVEAATASEASPQTAVPCRRRPQRTPCTGRLQAHQDAASGAIHWRCPLCGDAGMIYNWQATVHDLGGRPLLPKVSRIRLATGFQRRLGDSAALKELVFEGAAVTDTLRRAVLDNRITELAGEYGDPTVGSPVQVDRLEIEHEGGTTRITVYNRGIMLLHGSDEVMRRVHRVRGVVERAGGHPGGF